MVHVFVPFVNLYIYLSMYWSIDKLISWFVHFVIGSFTYLSVYRCIDWMFCLCIDSCMHRFIDLLILWSIGWLNCVCVFAYAFICLLIDTLRCLFIGLPGYLFQLLICLIIYWYCWSLIEWLVNLLINLYSGVFICWLVCCRSFLICLLAPAFVSVLMYVSIFLLNCLFVGWSVYLLIYCCVDWLCWSFAIYAWVCWSIASFVCYLYIGSFMLLVLLLY